MKPTVSDFLLARLRDEWGVHRLFGYPGDGINGILGALGRADGDPELIQVRHEEMAAFMACGHAKLTGEVGVCLATSGPGAIHLLNGLYDARMDHAPVVAIVGQQPRPALGGHQQQEVDLPNLFKDVASDYVQTVMVPEQLPAVVDRAVRIAKARRTVTCVILPHDVQELAAVEEPPRELKANPTSAAYSEPRVVPYEADLRRAAELLNAGEKVAMLVGAGARGAAREVVEVAERLGAGVAKALLGKDVLADDLPFVTGCIGLLGTRPSWELMQGCDTLLLVGTGFPYATFLPEWDEARAVTIDLDPTRVGLRFPAEVNLVGDSGETLRALLPLLRAKADRSWRQEIEKEVADWWDLMAEQARQPADPLNPQLVFWELSQRLPDGAIVTTDAGSSAQWYARLLQFRDGMRGSLSGNLATMGSGVPYALAAKLAYPQRPVFALVGDGAMQMNGMNELLTVGRYWRRFASPTFVVLVLANRDLNMVTWEMRALAGEPKLPESQDVPALDHARFAELCGLRGIRVDAPEQVGPAWDEALRADRPVVIDAICDPEVPPLPPHVTFEQAKHFAQAVLKGDPNAWRMIKQSFKKKVAEFTPG
jgi:pyruvate dehydrogenase (quinone)